MEGISLGREIWSSEELKQVLVAHEELVEDMEKAVLALENEKAKELDKLTNKIRETISKLLISFKGKDDLSTSLRSVYLLMNTLVLEGEIKKDPLQFQKALKAISPVIRGFKALESKK
ncbi:MAG: flagellar protein FliS [Tissierellaceae bacterium]